MPCDMSRSCSIRCVGGAGPSGVALSLSLSLTLLPLSQVWEPSDFARGHVGRDTAVIIKTERLAYLLRIALEAMAPR